MAGPKPQPTAEEFEALIERVRREPWSPAYVELGDAYLALGRPRDAIELAQQGLAQAPDDHAGRLILARAHAALHQWKEAQGELLQIVKVDRGNRAGFALLGEVLMRRGDHARAMPVLQHAQNLDPGSALVLGLLKAARNGQPLEAPPPIPTPIAPRRGEARPSAPPRAPAFAPAPPPPVFAPPPPPPVFAPPPPVFALAPPPVFAPPPPPVFAPAPPPRDIAVVAEQSFDRGDATVPSLPPDPNWASESPPSAPAPRATAEGAVVRPRVLPQAKPVNAAAASLRQSAAVGENYLNDLLTGGLLDVPGVRVPDASWDLRADRRWGRSSLKAFIILFVVLVLGLGGGGGWWWWSHRQQAQAVAAHREAARKLIASGTYAGLTGAIDELTAALRRDDSNPRTFAAMGEAHALRALVYGTAEPGIDSAILGAGHAIKSADRAGYRELVIARAAIALARLDGGEVALAALVSARTALDAFAKAHPDDRWARWLQGRALLAAGQRTAAAAAFAAAADGADGLPLAAIDRADLLIDDGRFDDGMKAYDDVLARTPDHSLAIVGKAVARAERGTDVAKAMTDLNVALDQELGPRIAAYRQLALALANYGIQKYVAFSEALARAHGLREPRFLVRVALARILDGKLGEAATALAQVRYYGKDPAEPDPLVALVNGAIQIASGEQLAALASLDKLGGTRASLLRGQALYDLGRFDDAARELAAAVAAAPDSVEVKIWAQLAAAATAAPGKARDQATADLEKTSRAATSKLGRHAHGLALLQQHDLRGAKRRLEQALENVTAEEPNPLAYRTHVALAEVARADGDRAAELKHLDLALTLNAGYRPARLARAQLYLATGDGGAAVPLIESVVAAPQYATGANYVLLAEAHVGRDLAAELLDDHGVPRAGVTKESLAGERRAAVLAALQQAKQAGADPAELTRVAGLVDAALIDELGLAPAEVAPASPPRRPPPRRRGR